MERGSAEVPWRHETKMKRQLGIEGWNRYILGGQKNYQRIMFHERTQRTHSKRPSRVYWDDNPEVASSRAAVSGRRDGLLMSMGVIRP